MNEAEAAWTAGIFEGEGHAGVTKTRSRRYARLVIKMTDEDVVRRFHEAVGCGNVKPYRPPSVPPHYKDAWRWEVSDLPSVERLVSAWLPWLGERRRAQVVHRLLEDTRRNGDPTQHNRDKTHCPRGHKFDGRHPDGRRFCRACKSANERARYLARKEKS